MAELNAVAALHVTPKSSEYAVRIETVPEFGKFVQLMKSRPVSGSMSMYALSADAV